MKRILATLDIETNKFKRNDEYKVGIIGLYFYIDNKENFVTFSNVADLFSYLEKTKIKFEIFAHNGGKFDFYFFLDYVEKPFFISSRLHSFEFKKHLFYDSFSLFPIALSKYKKDDFDYNLLDDFDKNYEVIKKYLFGDCKYLFEMVKKMTDLSDKRTIASVTFDTFLKFYGFNKKEFLTKNKSYDETFRKFYFGGRCDVFKSGYFKNVTSIDINSAYPYAMTVGNFPKGYSYISSTDEKDIKGKSFITIKAKAYKCFPRKNDKGELKFKDEKGIFNITGWEFLTAKKLGLIKDYEIIEILTHDEDINFNAYITHYFKEKENAKRQGDKLTEIITKFFLNSLYGKFGQSPENFSEYILIDEFKGLTFDKYLFCTQYGKKFLYQCESDCNVFFNVATASSITGFVRAYLLECIYNVYKCGNVPLYCDTDSIYYIDNNPLTDINLDKYMLGAWDIENEKGDIIICGKKMYCWSNENIVKVSSKGVKFTKEDIMRLYNKGIAYWKNDFPTFSLKKRKIDYIERTITYKEIKNSFNPKNFIKII